jgi:serine/threonine-protein kinase
MRTSADGKVMGDEQTALGRPLASGYIAGALLSGKYRLEAPLGEGGMGVVWRANNVLLDLPVAIKLIRADLDRGALRARLQLEARAAAKLGHSSIVRVFDVGESELGDPFIVMEHLRGETLAQLISQGRLPATRAVQLLLPIIDALAAAHARGIVHRDLKPDNVMIALEEQRVCPKILDFGIAKLTDPCDRNFKLTEAGSVLGSPEYMSPEQARGRDDIDASTDIWSTCVVLYEAVTGSPPFSASNCNALLRSIVEDDPKPLSEFGVDAPALWPILQRGLRKDKAQRYAQISELGQALAGWLVSQGVTEDACGSTLDSKWLGRQSGPVSLSRSTDAELSREPLQSSVRDSIPDSSEIARGPFTKTILPSAHGRTRTLGAALAACTLLAVSWVVVERWSHAAPTGAPAPAAAARAKELPSPIAPNQEPAKAITRPALESHSEPNVLEEGTRQETHAPKATLEAKPRVVAAPVKATSKPARAVPPATVSAVGSTPAAPALPAKTKSERPLDLLTPY